METSIISKAKIKKRDEKKEDGKGKEFQKTFTKNKKKIGLPVQFEDNKTKVDAQVRFKPRFAEGLCFIGNVLLEICIQIGLVKR